MLRLPKPLSDNNQRFRLVKVKVTQCIRCQHNWAMQ